MDGSEKNPGDHDDLTGFLASLGAEDSSGPWSRRVEYAFDLEGATGGRLEMRGELGMGGMGRVLLAHDTRLDRDVAVKVLEVPDRDDSTFTVRKFLHEARLTASLVHPGIAPVYDIGTAPDGRHFFVMQVVEGHTLRSEIEAAKAGMESGRTGVITRLLNCLIRVCETVGYIHSREVLHLDLKPGNIMVGPFGEVTVLDWGLAVGRKEFHEYGPVTRGSGSGGGVPGQRETTTSERVVGTPGYMSPEQTRGDLDHLTPASDVYALGVILHEILTGDRPGCGTEQTVPRKRRPFGRPVSLSDRVPRAGWPQIPRGLAAICEKALAVRPGDRYASARELGLDLQNYFDNRAVTAFRSGPAERLRLVVRRHLTISTAAAVLACVVLAFSLSRVVRFLPGGRHASALGAQVHSCRAEFDEATRDVLRLNRDYEEALGGSARRRDEIREQLTRCRARRYSTARALRTALAGLLAVAPDTQVDPVLLRELRLLWLEDLRFAVDSNDIEYARRSLSRMDREQGRFPWWAWEPDEAAALSGLRARLAGSP